MLKFLILTSSIFLLSVSGDEWQGISPHVIENSERSVINPEDLAINDNTPGRDKEAPCTNRRSAAADVLANDDSQWFRLPPLKWRTVLPIESKDTVIATGVTTTLKPLSLPPSKQELKSQENQKRDVFTNTLPPDHRPLLQEHQSSTKVRYNELDAYTNHFLNNLPKGTLPVFESTSLVKSNIPQRTELKAIHIAENGHRAVESECLLHSDSLYNSGRRSLSPKAEQILKLLTNDSRFNEPKVVSAHDNYENDTNGINNGTADTIKNEGDRRALMFTPNSNYIVKTNYAARLIEKNQLLEPTKGVDIAQLTSTNLKTLELFKVCYACSTVHDPSCWNPNRRTTVKYCRPGRESCVTRQYKNKIDGALVVIRDCSSACESMPLEELKYISCSICKEDLCNNQPVENNSSSNQFNIMLICFISGFAKYFF